MNRPLAIIVSISVALFFAGRANSQTPINSISAIPGVKSHFVTLDANKIHYLTVGKGAKSW